jgi:glycosyltransferase involved in cell wall biosynthesis
MDRAAFHGADLVVADTAAQARFYADALGLSPGRLEVALVGAEDALFRPGPRLAPRPFHVLFVGKLTPLHGLEVVLQAARLAPEVPFRVVGEGQRAALLRSAPPNVTHVPWVPYEGLGAEYREAGCALGVFGTGPKAQRVIPTKAFQALACACPLVTADTSAARELLTPGRDALLVPAGDARALAEAVRGLREDAALAERLGHEGRATYEARASEEVLGRRWRGILERVLAR